MRDIVITIIVFSCLPFILRRPFFGVMVWTWLGLMNPHRLAWGFSTTLPFAFIVFITTVIAYVASKEPRKLPMSREIWLLLIFIAWMFFTTTQAIYPDGAWLQWDKVWKIQLGIALTLMLTNSKERIQLLIWTVCVSLGFYGFKGGIWTVLSGGANRVYGPDRSFISGNNELGLALVMTIPLIWYLAMNARKLWVRNGLYAAIGFTAIAILGTHSRGALVGLAAMGLIFIMKSRRKFLPIMGALALAASLPYIMPSSWFDRMHTIETYEEDESAQERFQAWWASYRVANERITGGGFEMLSVVNGTDAHSIYFEVLGEQGYIGFVMFMTIAALTWLKASRIRKMTKGIVELRWANDLAQMVQASMIGYASCGAFLGLAYFDLYYILIAIIVVLHKVVAEGLSNHLSKVAEGTRPTYRHYAQPDLTMTVSRAARQRSL